MNNILGDNLHMFSFITFICLQVIIPLFVIMKCVFETIMLYRFVTNYKIICSKNLEQKKF